MAGTRRAVAARVWQHVPDGSGGCVHCGGPAAIMGRMGCTPGPARTLHTCPGGFTAGGIPCDCNGDDPSHRPVPVEDADFSHYIATDPSTTKHGKLQWPLVFLPPIVDDDELADDGARW